MARPRAGSPDKDRWKALASFVDGLYLELDKLAKKAPRETLSDLAVARTNRAIRDAKSFLTGFDEYAADWAEFVPAGDNPEVRDAVLVLGEVKTALARVWAKYELGFR